LAGYADQPDLARFAQLCEFNKRPGGLERS